MDMDVNHLVLVREILKRHISNCQVWAFGSRVNGTAKEYSDLDLVILSKEDLPPQKIFQLKDDFEESDLPFRVDLLDWNKISKDFQNIIQARYEVIQSG